MTLKTKMLLKHISGFHHNSNNLHFHCAFHFKVANTQITSVYHQSVGVRYTTVVQHAQHRYANSSGRAAIAICCLGEGGLGCDGQG